MRFGAPPPPEFLLQTGTPIGAADAAANMTFAVGDFNSDGVPDLFALKHSNTGSGMLEVHILSGASNYQTFLLHIATPIGTAGAAANFTFAVGDFNRDGVPDVFAL
jgi:kumamolisin